MTYTISEVAEKMGVSVHTLRFYDKEGLLPFVDRINGRRVFKDSDFAWLRILNCLKNTGMPLKEIRRYMELCQLGDSSLVQRQEIICRQKEAIEEQIRQLQENLKMIEYKVWYYETAIAAGTESIHFDLPCNPTMEPDTIPKEET
ncbi:MAG: MerR family transcriptional regulator [Faecousia sp.]